MNPKVLGKLAYQLLGVVALIFAIHLLPVFLSTLAFDFKDSSWIPMNTPLFVLAYAIPIVVLLIGGVFLILKAESLGNVNVEHAADSRAATAADVHSILFSAAGVVLVGISIGSLPSVLRDIAVHNYTNTGAWSRLASLALQAALGTFLFLRGSSLVTLLRRRHDRAHVAAADGRCPHCGYWIDTSEYRQDAKAYLCGNCRQELPRDLVDRAL